MKVDLSTVLACPVDKAWAALQTSALLQHVAWPLARIAPAGTAPLPERWAPGMTVQCRPYIFGFIPIGLRTLHFERIDADKHEWQTRESDPLVRRWDHLISISADKNGRTVYRDQIDIDAGAITVLVWAWAGWFYRHRQRRWRTLARSL
jgi:hypothetical protein